MGEIINIQVCLQTKTSVVWGKEVTIKLTSNKQNA